MERIALCGLEAKFVREKRYVAGTGALPWSFSVRSLAADRFGSVWLDREWEVGIASVVSPITSSSLPPLLFSTPVVVPANTVATTLGAQIRRLSGSRRPWFIGKLRELSESLGHARALHYRPEKKRLIFWLRNLASVVLLAAPAVCPQSDGIGINSHFGMNGAS